LREEGKGVPCFLFLLEAQGEEDDPHEEDPDDEDDPPEELERFLDLFEEPASHWVELGP
jgi:hypothetical protein